MIERANNWISGLGAAQKVLFWIIVMLFAFSSSLLGTVALLTLVGFAERSIFTSVSTPSEESTLPTDTSSDFDLQISGARWEGDKAVVEGRWNGEVSSVHCDLLDGGPEGSVTDWWDRKSRAQMDWSGRSFSQEFFKVTGREVEDPIDLEKSYWVVCWALFSNGGQMSDEAPLEGSPKR